MLKLRDFFPKGLGFVARWVYGAIWWITAGLAAAAPAAWARCPEGISSPTLWSDRETSIRLQQQLPEACLKSLVRQCDAQAESGLLDGNTAASCSFRYEALLRQEFRGDFGLFLRWWQATSQLAVQ